MSNNEPYPYHQYLIKQRRSMLSSNSRVQDQKSPMPIPFDYSSSSPSSVARFRIPQSEPANLPQSLWHPDGAYILTQEPLRFTAPIYGVPCAQPTWLSTSNLATSNNPGVDMPWTNFGQFAIPALQTPTSQHPPPSPGQGRHDGGLLTSDEAVLPLPLTYMSSCPVTPNKSATKAQASFQRGIRQTTTSAENLKDSNEPLMVARSHKDQDIHEQQDERHNPGGPSPSTPEKSVSGRPSNCATKALAEGFAELDTIIHKLKESTGLSPKQILKRWQPANPREVNDWNIYQKYFRANVSMELSRLPQEKRPSDTSLETIRAAYTAFREAEPNSSSILRIFWRIHEIDESNTTFNGRCHEFNKYVSSLKRLSESASTINGFETVFCVVGGVVQQDQSLSSVFCSKMVPNFFADRLRLSDSDMEGHLKAHVYDYTSRRLLAESSSVVSSASQAGTKEEYRKLLSDLKQKFTSLIDPCKILDLTKPASVFSDIPSILAQNGWIIENWPEEVPFPCDLGKGKGIAKLEKCYREPLLESFNDPLFPLRVVKKYIKAVPPSEPVIIGIPPAPDSKYERGRRRFFNDKQTEDRNGPSRRVRLAERRVSTSTNAQMASKHAKKRVTRDEADAVTKASVNEKVKRRKVS